MLLLEVDVTLEDGDHRPETREWRLRLKDLPPNVRTEIRALHAVRPWANAVVVLYPVLWICSIALMERWPILYVRLAGVLVIALSLQAIGSLMHEALHGNLFRNPFFDRWIGFVLAVPTLFSCSAYKVAHLNHHRYTRTERDQDEFSYSCRTHGQYVALFYVSFLVGSLLYMILVPWKAYAMASLKSRQKIVTEYLVMLLAFSTAFLLAVTKGHAEWIFWYWLAPFLVAVLMANVRALAEHMGTQGKGDALAKTRTVTSNRLVSFLMLNLNYHLEHHLFPGIPWYNLQKLHRLLKPIYESRGAEVRRSYIAYAIRCLMKIPDPVDALPRDD